VRTYGGTVSFAWLAVGYDDVQYSQCVRVYSCTICGGVFLERFAVSLSLSVVQSGEHALPIVAGVGVADRLFGRGLPGSVT